MEEVAIYGNLNLADVRKVKTLLEPLFPGINLIDSDKVLDYENNQFEFCIEPLYLKGSKDLEEGELHMTGRYYGSIENALEVLILFGSTLEKEGIKVIIDYQLENEHGEPLGDEERISEF